MNLRQLFADENNSRELYILSLTLSTYWNEFWTWSNKNAFIFNNIIFIEFFELYSSINLFINFSSTGYSALTLPLAIHLLLFAAIPVGQYVWNRREKWKPLKAKCV